MPSEPADGLSGRDLACYYRRNWRAVCCQYPPMGWAEEILRVIIEETDEPYAVSTRRWTERKCKRATGALMCRMPSMPTKGQRRSGHKEATCKRTTSLEQPTVHLIAPRNFKPLDCTLQRGTLEPHSPVAAHRFGGVELWVNRYNIVRILYVHVLLYRKQYTCYCFL